MASANYDAAAQAALCNMLSAVGAGAASYAAWGLMTPGPFDEWAAVGIAGVAGLAYTYGCAWDSVNNKGTPVGWTPGCQQTDIGVTLVAQAKSAPSTIVDHWYDVVEILQTYADERGRARCQYRQSDGAIKIAEVAWLHTDTNWYLRTAGTNAVCGKPIAPRPIQPPAPYTYTDSSSNCQINVNFQGWAVDAAGRPGPVWKLEPAGATALASGGIIGGCNFKPVVYYQPPSGGGGGGGGGGNWVPWAPGPDGPGGEPWWMEPIRAVGGGIVSGAVSGLIREIFEEKVAGKTYRLVSVCETDAQGEPISQSREVSIPTLPLMQGAIYRLDAIEYLLQGLKDFKQPTCNTRPTYSGDPVTVRFQSDEISASGHDFLRKHFTYRDTTSSPLEIHTDHWADFAWDAGPVIVTHTGGPWGVCKVWAKSVDEGKRVIRHAGSVAGVDPDDKGRWIISGSADPRFGQTGRMRVQRRNGAICVSKRAGSSGLPLLAMPVPHS